MLLSAARPLRMPTTTRRWRFSAEAYNRMGALGIIPEDARTELIGGVIYEMAPIGDGHAFSSTYLNTLLARHTPPDVFVAMQNPLRLSDDTIVQPDVMIVRGEAMATVRAITAPDALLVIEVADSSERHDRRRKLPRYARTGVPEVWLVLVARGQIEVYRTPGPGGYAEVATFEGEDVVASAAVPEIALTVAEVLGKRE